MRGILDDGRLNGALEAHIIYRPERSAVPIAHGRSQEAISEIEIQCQIWGGSSTPLIPLDDRGFLPPEYERIVRGEAIDDILGLDYGALALNDPLRPTPPGSKRDGFWGSQFAPALLEYKRQDQFKPMEVVELSTDDPWHDIYTACLGRLPRTPHEGVLRSSGLPDLEFDDFLRVERASAVGSLEDLAARLTSLERLTPRQLAGMYLGGAQSASTSIRLGPRLLPESSFDGWDAGPNIVVLFSPGSVADLALLWNLRCAHGDSWLLPIGLPIGQADDQALESLIRHPQIARHGIAANLLYITSASLTEGEIRARLGEGLDNPGRFKVSPPSRLLTFREGRGWFREEILIWHEGTAQFRPLTRDSQIDVFTKAAALSDTTRMIYELKVPSYPFPECSDLRIRVLNGTFVHGSYTGWESLDARSQVREVEWPSSLLMARTIASRRGVDLSSSEAGRACQVLLNGLEDLSDLSLLAHEPLLTLLERMAARQGFGWFKQRQRDEGKDTHPLDAVSPSTDALPAESFPNFQRVLGNREAAAKYWLLWAETAGLVVKGFSLECVLCRAKQWIPVNAFSPPEVCRGCGQTMKTPFGDRPMNHFTYRISERLRRVFEHDALGHLLVARYFDSVFRHGRTHRLVGLHPGMDMHVGPEHKRMGEADVLMLTRRGEFIPVEVKRRANGLTEAELSRLDSLGGILGSPWVAVAATQYGLGSESLVEAFVTRNDEGAYTRVALTYDRLLDLFPKWTVNDDPFSTVPLSEDQRHERERDFVENLVGRARATLRSSLEWNMLSRPLDPG